MEKIMQALEAMEEACADPAALLSTRLPELEALLDEVRALPEDRRPELFDRLERIRAVMEAQMLLYEEEVAQLRVQIREAQRNSKAMGAYNRVAVLQVNKNTTASE